MNPTRKCQYCKRRTRNLDCCSGRYVHVSSVIYSTVDKNDKTVLKVATDTYRKVKNK